MVQAQQIKEHMEVCGNDGAHVGTVDCTKDSNKIFLTKSDPKSDDKIRLKKSAKDAMAQWQTAA
ncbi:MAG: DUF2171 domain-containing protein [Pseudolabrys sp.]